MRPDVPRMSATRGLPGRLGGGIADDGDGRGCSGLGEDMSGRCGDDGPRSEDNWATVPGVSRGVVDGVDKRRDTKIGQVEEWVVNGLSRDNNPRPDQSD